MFVHSSGYFKHKIIKKMCTATAGQPLFFHHQRRRPPSTPLHLAARTAMHLEPFHCSAVGSIEKTQFFTKHLRIRWDLNCAKGWSQWSTGRIFAETVTFFQSLDSDFLFYKSYLKWRKKHCFKIKPKWPQGHSQKWKVASIWQTRSKEEGHHVRGWDSTSCIDHFLKAKNHKVDPLVDPVSFAQLQKGSLTLSTCKHFLNQISHLWVLWNGNHIRKTFERKRFPLSFIGELFKESTVWSILDFHGQDMAGPM